MNQCAGGEVVNDIIVWPDSTQIKQGKSTYSTPDGEFPRITTVLRVLGLGKEYITNWAAAQEREAVIEAANRIYEGRTAARGKFPEAVKAGLGEAKAHIRALEKAGEIGLAVHGRASWLLKAQLGEVQGPCPALGSEAAEIAFEAYEAWWKAAGLTPVRSEQVVWDPEWGFAGTVDLIAEDRNGDLGIVDLKTSKYTYTEHHIQVAAYVKAANRWAPIKWSKLVRLPKSANIGKIGKENTFEVVELGNLQDRTVHLLELQDDFKCALKLWKSLVS